MRRVVIAIVVCAVVFCATVLLWSDRAADLVWYKWHIGSVALALDRNNAELAQEIGNYYYGIGEYDPDVALRAFKKSVAIEPSILWGHYDIARILFVKGLFSEARTEIGKELQYNPPNLRSYYMLGLINAYDHNLPEAERNFKTFIAWAPSEWAGYNDYAWVLAQEGKYQEAKEILNVAFEKISDAQTNAWLWNNLGVQNLNLKEYGEAQTDFQKAKELAAKLTEDDWHRAYPGNDPTSNADGIEAFKNAVEKNLELAESAL